MVQRPFPAYNGDAPYIFVCYAHADADDVYATLTWLRDHGVNIWYDEGISPGTRWSDELAEALNRAAMVLFFCSDNSVASKHCRDEIAFAVDEDKTILVVQQSEVALPPGLKLQLGARQAIVASQLPARQFKAKLLEALPRNEAATDPIPTPSPAATTGPGDNAFSVAGIEDLESPRGYTLTLLYYIAFLAIGIAVSFFSGFSAFSGGERDYLVNPDDIVDVREISSRLGDTTSPAATRLWNGLNRDSRDRVTALNAGVPVDEDEAGHVLRLNLNELIIADIFVLGSAETASLPQTYQALAEGFAENPARSNRMTLDLLLEGALRRWVAGADLRDAVDRVLYSARYNPVRAWLAGGLMVIALLAGAYYSSARSIRVTLDRKGNIEGVLSYLVTEMGFRPPEPVGDMLVFRGSVRTFLAYNAFRAQARVSDRDIILTAPTPLIRRIRKNLLAMSTDPSGS